MFSRPGLLIVIGFVMVFLGFLLPLLMVAKVIEATIFLSFLSHGVSVAGLFLGIIGASMVVRTRRPK